MKTAFLRRLSVSVILSACLRSVGVVALASVAALGASSAIAQTAPTKLVGADEISKEMAAKGTARVIISLANDDDTRDLSRRLGSRAEQAQAIADIRRRSSAVLRDIFPNGRDALGNPVKSYDYLPSIAATVTPAALRRLEADQRVYRIDFDEIKTIDLNASLPLMGMQVGSGIATDAAPNGKMSDGTRRTVVVIDTGVDKNHPFIGASRVVAEACFLYSGTCGGSVASYGPGAGMPSPNESHGTHVAGIAAGRFTGLTGATVFRGVASEANIVAINIFGAQGGAATSDIISALDFVLKLKNGTAPGYSGISFPTIDSINMSLGGGGSSTACDTDPTAPIITTLRNADILTVIAAGNGSSRTVMSSPGCVTAAISVAATAKTSRTIAGYSNISTVTDVFAPGGDSANGGCVRSSIIGTGYADYCGTSMATPHVTGVIALLRAEKPSATADEIEAALETNMQIVRDTRSSGTISKPFVDIPTAFGNLRKSAFSTVTVSLAQGSGTGTRSGVITSSPGGFTCASGRCTGYFVQGSRATFTALADAQSVFKAWSNVTCASPTTNTTPTCDVTIPAASTMSATATFDSNIVALTDGVDYSATTLSGGGNASWTGARTTRVTDGDVGRNSPIGNSQTSSMLTSISGPGTLAFTWAVSSEANYDFLRFYVNNVRQSQISGSYTGFAQRSVTLPCGTQNLRWSFEKDGSLAGGEDAGYVNAITFTRATGVSCLVLTATKVNPTFGTVTSTSPTGMTCGTSCTNTTGTFNSGTLVTLQATPVSGRTFVGWSNNCAVLSATTCRATMDVAKTVTATFQ